MRNSFWALMLVSLFIACPFARVQEETSQLEAYGSYDYVRFNVHSKTNGVISSDSYNSSGGSGQLEFNANRWFGIIGDLSRYVVTKGEPVAGAFSYLFGPRLNFRRGKLRHLLRCFSGDWSRPQGLGPAERRITLPWRPEAEWTSKFQGTFPFGLSRRSIS